MKRWFALVMLALTVLTMGLPTSTRAAEIDHFQYSGPTAEAVFASSDPSGCINTLVFVVANDQRTHHMGQPAAHAFAKIFISQVDHCAGGALLLASAETSDVTAEMFQVDQRLQSAALTMRLNAFDDISGTTGPLTIDVMWTAHGDAPSVKSRREIRTADVLIKKRLDGTFRPAIATGTVSFNGSQNLIPEPAENQDTLISSARYGEIEIHH